MEPRQCTPFGIFSWFGWVLPLPERLDLIRKAGFASTSLWWEDEIGFPAIGKVAMADLVRASGLHLENVHVPYDRVDDLWSESNSCRNGIVNQYLLWIDEFVHYNIPIMVMHIMDHFYPPLPNERGLESIRRIVAAAQQAGIMIAIENTGDIGLIDYVLAHIESKHLGFCYDSSHDWLYSTDKGMILNKWGHRLLSTHLADNDGELDRHWLPGEGIVDWQLIRRLLPPDDYSGAISLEVAASQTQRHNLTPPQYLGAAYGKLASLFGKSKARPD